MRGKTGVPYHQYSSSVFITSIHHLFLVIGNHRRRKEVLDDRED